MKKLILTIIVLFSINLQAAPDVGGEWKRMPPTLCGEWGYRLYGVGDSPLVTRVNYTRLLQAYPDRIEGGAEVMYIKKIVVTYNDYDEAWITITFKNRPGYEMEIRHMKEADTLTVFIKKDGIDFMYFHFNVYGEDGWRKSK